MDLDQLIAELRSLADQLSERSRPRDASDPLGAVLRVALAEEVVAIVRHDMRNKLGSIRNAAFYLRRRTEPTDLWRSDPRMKEFFTLIDDMVDEATQSLANPLGQRLGPRRAPRAPTRVSAREIVDLAAAGTRVPEGVRLSIDAGDGALEVDRLEMALAVRCLLDNAVEASVGGAVQVSTREDGDCHAIVVADEGSGIPQEDMNRIFEAFFSTKEGHAGVGLNMARRIARRHGGDLGVVSDARGTTATLVVPGPDREGGP